MPEFSRKPLKPSPLLARIRARPFLFFGAPFLVLTIGSSFLMTIFTQTRYDLHHSRHKQLSFEEEMGLTGKRKKIDLREEYFRLSNPGVESQLDLTALSATEDTALSASGDSGDAPSRPIRKKKPFSMAPVTQDEFENIRVPRPEGMPEWGAPGEAGEDAPIKGRRKEDRWV